MEKSLQRLEIVSPKGKEFDGKVLSVSVPTTDGRITVLPNHMQLVTLISNGDLIYKTDDNKEEVLKVIDGVLEIRKGKVVAIIHNFDDLNKK